LGIRLYLEAIQAFRFPEEGIMQSNDPVIIMATITPPAGWGDMAKVTAKLSDGTEAEVFRYFDDELSFSAQQFTGLTITQACELKFKADVAYLRG
jgi:hypothetical protein